MTRMAEKTFTTHVHAQLRATRGLLKFCHDHGCKSPYLRDVEDCARALERGDMAESIEAYQRVPLGGSSCFNDWWPPAVFEHETEDYASGVFEALCLQWSLLMRLSCDDGAKDG